MNSMYDCKKGANYKIYMIQIFKLHMELLYILQTFPTSPKVVIFKNSVPQLRQIFLMTLFPPRLMTLFFIF